MGERAASWRGVCCVCACVTGDERGKGSGGQRRGGRRCWRRGSGVVVVVRKEVLGKGEESTQEGKGCDERGSGREKRGSDERQRKMARKWTENGVIDEGRK